LIDLIPSFSSSQLHFIPSLLPEAILATKDTSEKARTSAFDLLVVMGGKMSQGGVINRALLVDGMNVEESGNPSTGELPFLPPPELSLTYVFVKLWRPLRST
jgi:ribosomal RNA-processing protein 12